MIDVNKPLENPRLKELFSRKRQARTDRELDAVMNSLAEEIVMNAYFLSVIQLSEEPEIQADGRAVFKKDTTMQVPMLFIEDGRQFYPAFIDWEELNKWEAVKDTRPKTLILSFDDYAGMVLNGDGGDGVAINPFSDNLVLDQETLAHWRGQKQLAMTGHAECRAAVGSGVWLGDPKEYPDAMVKAMAAYAKRDRSIRELWLRLMERDGERSYLVVVDFQGDRNTVFAGLAGAARPHLNGMHLDLVPHADRFGQEAVLDVEPFYQKKHGWFTEG